MVAIHQMMRLLTAFALLVTSNVATAYITAKNARPKRHSVETVLNEVRGTSSTVVILGDSLVEDAKFPREVCGVPIINGGIGGSRAASVIAIAEQMQGTPALIIISVGVNDAGSVHFPAAYSLLLNSLPKTKIAVASLAQTGFTDIDKEIRNAAKRHGVSLIDMSGILAFETVDGIHPAAHSYPDWRKRLLDGARAALGCEAAS